MNGIKEVKIFGEQFKVKANIKVLHSFSAHADYEEICHFLSNIDPELVTDFFVVHGEPEVQDEFIKKMKQKGYANVVAPALHEHFFV